jgi:tetratricopeptide (TPR) repeat protein
LPNEANKPVRPRIRPRATLLPCFALILGGTLVPFIEAPRAQTAPPDPPAAEEAVEEPAAAPAPEPDWVVAGWQRVLAAGNPDEAREALVAIEAGGVAHGIGSLKLPALALLRADDRTVKLPRSERLAWARRLGHDSAAVQFAAARASLAVGLGESLWGYTRAIGTLGRDFGYLAGVVSRLVVVLAMGLAFAFILFTGAMVLKYGMGLLHDVGHPFPVELPFAFRVAAGVALAGAPLALGLGWLGLAAVWVLFLWGTLSRVERGVAAIFLALLAAAQPIATGVAALLPAPESQPSLAAILRVQAGAPTEADQAFLREEASRAPDPVALFSLSRAAWLEGDAEEAMVAARGALEVRPGWVPAMNNLAILLLEAGRMEEAESVLREALAKRPKDVSLLFNLSYLYRKDFRLREAETAYRQARAIDQVAVDRFTRVTGSQGIFVIPALLGYGDLWQTRMRLDAGSKRLAENLAAPFLGRLPLGWVAPAVLLGVGLAIGISRLLGRRGRAGRCGHCGTKVCPTCLGNELQNGVCTPCHIIYVKASPVEARVRLGQDQRVIHHRAGRRRRILLAGWIVPGLGHLLTGHVIGGMGLLLVASLAAYAPLWLFLTGSLQGLWAPPLSPPLGGIVALTAWAGVLLAFGGGARDLLGKVRPI